MAGLETATYISDLNSSNPAAGDAKSQGDDHLRLLKSTIKATFPNVAGAVTPTHTELNYVDGVTSAIQTQINSLAGGWKLIKSSAATSGAAVDFVNGGSGVVLDSTYSAYQFEFISLLPTSNGDTFQVLLSGDAGSTWDASYVYNQNGASGTGTVINAAVAVASSGTGLSGSMELYLPSSSAGAHIRGVVVYGGSVEAQSFRTFSGVSATTHAITGVRIKFGSSNFAGTTGVIRLYGR